MQSFPAGQRIYLELNHLIKQLGLRFVEVVEKRLKQTEMKMDKATKQKLSFDQGPREVTRVMLVQVASVIFHILSYINGDWLLRFAPKFLGDLPKNSRILPPSSFSVFKQKRISHLIVDRFIRWLLDGRFLGLLCHSDAHHRVNVVSNETAGFENPDSNLRSVQNRVWSRVPGDVYVTWPYRQGASCERWKGKDKNRTLEEKMKRKKGGCKERGNDGRDVKGPIQWKIHAETCLSHVRLVILHVIPFTTKSDQFPPPPPDGLALAKSYLIVLNLCWPLSPASLSSGFPEKRNGFMGLVYGMKHTERETPS